MCVRFPKPKSRRVHDVIIVSLISPPQSDLWNPSYRAVSSTRGLDRCAIPVQTLLPDKVRGHRRKHAPYPCKQIQIDIARRVQHSRVNICTFPSRDESYSDNKLDLSASRTRHSSRRHHFRHARFVRFLLLLFAGLSLFRLHAVSGWVAGSFPRVLTGLSHRLFPFFPHFFSCFVSYFPRSTSLYFKEQHGEASL